jgi:probable selenium-dependent hydroxylase accessory protein YqeC
MQPFEELASLADYVLVEADGSKHLPLKAHLEHEPVSPACANQVIQVVGLSGIGCPISQAVHRPERFAELSGVQITDIATLERTATVLNTEALADRYVLNQADDLEERKWGLSLSFLLHKPSVITSLK